MSTFQELQDRLATLKAKRSILQHLMEHLDSKFLSHGGTAPQKLLGDDKLPIPEKSFEDSIADLIKSFTEVEREIQAIQQTQLAPVTPPAAEVVAAPKKSKKKSEPEPVQQAAPVPPQGEAK